MAECACDRLTRVSMNYLQPHGKLRTPYRVSACIFSADSDRLSVQDSLGSEGYRPTNLFEELNLAASRYGCERLGPPFSLWIEPILVGRGTPDSGEQDGVSYEIDHAAFRGNGAFFARGRARRDLVLSDWIVQVGGVKGNGGRAIITPRIVAELPPVPRNRIPRFGPNDISPETGFVHRYDPEGPYSIWLPGGSGIGGLRPATLECTGDVSAVWNLDDSEVYLAVRKATSAPSSR